MTCVSKKRVSKLLLELGARDIKCQNESMRDLKCKRILAFEILSFVGFWSRELLASDQARAGWVSPNLRELPPK